MKDPMRNFVDVEAMDNSDKEARSIIHFAYKCAKDMRARVDDFVSRHEFNGDEQDYLINRSERKIFEAIMGLFGMYKEVTASYKRADIVLGPGDFDLIDIEGDRE